MLYRRKPEEISGIRERRGRARANPIAHQCLLARGLPEAAYVPVPGVRVKGTGDLVPRRDSGAARVKNGGLISRFLPRLKTHI